MERYGLMAVGPTLTALLLSSLNDLQFFFVFFVLSFRVFVRKALQVNVPVAIFFLTLDYNLLSLTFSRRTVATRRRFSCSSQCGSLGTEL